MMIFLKAALGVAAAGYLSSGILLMRDRRKIGRVVLAIAWLFNAAVVAVNWITNGYVPFVSMYQVLTFLGLCFPLCMLYVEGVLKDRYSPPWFCFCAAAVATGTVFMDATVIWRFAPALQSGWFVPHVFCYMLSYTLCTVASLLAAWGYFRKSRAREIDESVYHLILLAFPFMTAGMMFGAIWANGVWTEFWSWDAKENWAFLTWLCYALYLHCRRSAKLRKFARPCAIVGFIALFMAFQGVNLFGTESAHAYT